MASEGVKWERTFQSPRRAGSDWWVSACSARLQTSGMVWYASWLVARWCWNAAVEAEWRACDQSFCFRWFVGNSDRRPMILCARSTLRSREQSTKHQAASTCERFVYSTVKIARFYDYQKWPKLLRNSWGTQRFVGFYFLDCAFRVPIGWLAGQADSWSYDIL